MIPTVEIQMDIMIQMEKQYFWNYLVSSLNFYIKSFYENSTSISLETQYHLQYISVNEIVQQNKTEILTKISLKENHSYHKSYEKKRRNRKLIRRSNITLTIKNSIKHNKK